jgi:hypothetical protein
MRNVNSFLLVNLFFNYWLNMLLGGSVISFAELSNINQA